MIPRPLSGAEPGRVSVTARGRYPPRRTIGTGSKNRVESSNSRCHRGSKAKGFAEEIMRAAEYARIEKAILYLGENFRRQPNLKEVARTVGLSEYHFHRLFTRWAGISPKRFLQFLTAEYAGRLLRESPNVLDAAYEAGLSGSGRLHDLLVSVYAMTPGEMKKKGAGLTIQYGDCLLAIPGGGICGLSFLSADRGGEAWETIGKPWSRATLRENPRVTKNIASRIFDPSRWKYDSPLNVFVRGTNFQIKVWE